MKITLSKIKIGFDSYKRYLPILVVVVAAFYLMIPFFQILVFQKINLIILLGGSY